MVSTSDWHAAGRDSMPTRTRHVILIRCKNLALNIRDCLSLCLLEENVCPFYRVPMPGEVKYPTQRVNV